MDSKTTGAAHCPHCKAALDRLVEMISDCTISMEYIRQGDDCDWGSQILDFHDDGTSTWHCPFCWADLEDIETSDDAHAFLMGDDRAADRSDEDEANEIGCIVGKTDDGRWSLSHNGKVEIVGSYEEAIARCDDLLDDEEIDYLGDE